jgi:hypothetical protein
MGRDSHHAGAGIYAVHIEFKDYCAMHNDCSRGRLYLLGPVFGISMSGTGFSGIHRIQSPLNMTRF